ncbi:DNA phosphorothioation-dependent restriction protein DptG [Aphanomyces invadans]|uniref:DNA phosphorothioation-dependent restriction protein DptG n=1 Tax=Aphanomyces invadans TaxID=157072 RepID=A0A024TR86_9STRA|nr:DNA phosphorothioation-dependent restriction protein DptG [Aphanomyces invadans]ETV96528.1 DNA phosphorothioation-dependent restriction protein DptG [Aphanomyces invadans]RHY27528.1 hypothetical protein DYB32_007216 [Aphanomyces invadans]|eukprot:XP_008874791.1 DNA phosphorothioation-dependent restriction protein DptG [Aphanomyces invadans]
MTITALLCSDQAPPDAVGSDHQAMLHNNSPDTAGGGDTTHSQQQLSSDSSSQSKTDQKMLDYFMEFSNSSDENRKKLTRRVKHRINNKRHRQRKQVELDQLRRDVPDLERQLRGLEAVAESRRATAAQKSMWHQLAQIEKKKLDDAVEERDVLQKTIKAHEVLVALYETQLKRPDALPWLQNRPASFLPAAPPPSSNSTSPSDYPRSLTSSSGGRSSPQSASSSTSSSSAATPLQAPHDNSAARQLPRT